MEADAVLATLRAHPVIARLVDATVSRSKAPEHKELYALAAQDAREVEELVRLLGELQYEPAIPTLDQIHRSYPVGAVRDRARISLWRIGSPAALEMLDRSLDVRHADDRSMALGVIVMRDPKGAFDRLNRHLTAATFDEAIADAVLQALAEARRDDRGSGNQAWNAAMREDERWLVWALGLRKRYYAETLLTRVPADEIERARATLPEEPEKPKRARRGGPAAVPASYAGPRDFLARYEAGHHELVWRELVSIGPLTDAALRQEARAVAAATMRRVRANVQMTTERLVAIGFPFAKSRTPIEPPPADVEQLIANIEGGVGGPVPESLAAFWRVIGGVIWERAADDDDDEEGPGDHPFRWDWDLDATVVDPLWVEGPGVVWSIVEREASDDDDEPLALVVAPDADHKLNASGGPSYTILAPNPAADALLENEPHKLLFVDYLRHMFRDGGLGSPAGIKLRPRAIEFRSWLVRDLVPF